MPMKLKFKIAGPAKIEKSGFFMPEAARNRRTSQNEPGRPEAARAWGQNGPGRAGEPPGSGFPNEFLQCKVILLDRVRIILYDGRHGQTV